MRVHGDRASVIVVPDSHRGLPYLSGAQGSGDTQGGIRRSRISREVLPECHLSEVGVLRAVPRDRLQLRESAHGAGRHLLLLRVRVRESTHWYSQMPTVPTTPFRGTRRFRTFPPSANVVRELHIYDWHLRRSVQSGAYVLNAFHFKKPRADLKANSSVSRDHALAEHEVYDYPGEYYEKSEGNEYARTRIEELQAQYERVRGQTNVRALFPGGLFELTDYPRKDQNREYLVLSTRHSLHLGDYGSAGGEGLTYSCTFSAMSSREPFRPERTSPKVFVQGPQTAIVVGPVRRRDSHGRVRPGEGAISLGSLRQVRREQLLLDTRGVGVGR